MRQFSLPMVAMSHLVGPAAAMSDSIGGCHTPDPRRYSLISKVLVGVYVLT